MRVPAEAGADPALTPTEQRLLNALRGRPGQAFTRAELMAQAMPDAVVLERTIDVHIKSLRKKLGDEGRRIETVRKVGYRWSHAALGERATSSDPDFLL